MVLLAERPQVHNTNVTFHKPNYTQRASVTTRKNVTDIFPDSFRGSRWLVITGCHTGDINAVCYMARWRAGK